MSAELFAFVVFLLHLLPSRGERDEAFRFANAEAILSVTEDAHEREMLGRIGTLESGWRLKVANCTVKGRQGELGTYQVKPITPADAKAACGSPKEQAALALRYTQRSADACPGSVGAARLNVYVSGKCWPKALPEAVARWGPEDEKALP